MQQAERFEKRSKGDTFPNSIADSGTVGGISGALEDCFELSTWQFDQVCKAELIGPLDLPLDP